MLVDIDTLSRFCILLRTFSTSHKNVGYTRANQISSPFLISDEYGSEELVGVPDLANAPISFYRGPLTTPQPMHLQGLE